MIRSFILFYFFVAVMTLRAQKKNNTFKSSPSPSGAATIRFSIAHTTAKSLDLSVPALALPNMKSIRNNFFLR
jgi:hypothetical protein